MREADSDGVRLHKKDDLTLMSCRTCNTLSLFCQLFVGFVSVKWSLCSFVFVFCLTLSMSLTGSHTEDEPEIL